MAKIVGDRERERIEEFQRLASSVWIVKADSLCPPKRILVGIDFSNLSRLALKKAGWIASCSNAVLDVVHGVDSGDLFADLKFRPIKALENSAYRHQIQADAFKELEKWCADMLSSTTTRTPRVFWGSPWKVLADRSRRWQFDLFVLGTVWPSGAAGYVLGNTAVKTLSPCDCSLFTVKSPEFLSRFLPPFWELHPAEMPRSTRIAKSMTKEKENPS